MSTTKAKKIKGSFDVCLSPDGRFLASCSRDVFLWSCPKLKKVWSSRAPAHTAYLTFSPDSSLLAAKSTSGRVVVFSTSSGEVVCDFNTADGEGGTLVFDADSSLIVDGAWNGSHIVRTLDGGTAFRERFEAEMIIGVLRHPDGRIWFRHQKVGEDKGDGRPQQRLTGRNLPFSTNVFQEIEIPFYSYHDIAFSPDGGSIAILSGHQPHVLTIFSFPGMQALSSTDLPMELRLAKCVRYSPCGRTLAVVSSDVLLFLSVGDPSVQRRIPIRFGRGVAYSALARLLVVASSGGEVFDTDETGMPLTE